MFHESKHRKARCCSALSCFPPSSVFHTTRVPSFSLQGGPRHVNRNSVRKIQIYILTPPRCAPSFSQHPQPANFPHPAINPRGHLRPPTWVIQTRLSVTAPVTTGLRRHWIKSSFPVAMSRSAMSTAARRAMCVLSTALVTITVPAQPT